MSRWRSVWLVARRELIERGRSRAFLLSLGLTMGIILAGIFLPSLIGGATGTNRLGIVGNPPPTFYAQLGVISAASNVKIQTEQVPDEATGEGDLRSGSLDGLLVVPSDGGLPTFVVKERKNGSLGQIVGASLSSGPSLTFRELTPADPNRDTSFLFANVGVILLFISIFTFGTWVLTGVVEEKQSRVVEVVLSTVDARDLLMGKVLGIGLLGLVQLVLMVVVGLGAGVAAHRFTLPPATFGAVAQLFLWFGLGYALYSTALGVLGALASRMEEASNAASPVSFIAMGAYFFSLIVALDDPSGTAARIATFIPPVAPMVVPLRTALGAIEPWEVVVSAALTVATIWVLFVVGGRVYSGVILRTGGRIGLREAWRISRQ
ncbi:MAG TPA: ABC transporter permease [Verrucomicrobiae bacterium]|nr:ABC transporter permease [Verrucomicrobiae bacterium]